MIVFAREVFACVCPTDVPDDGPDEGDLARRMILRRGGVDDLAALDPRHHSDEHVDELRQRLARDEHWVLGELDGTIVTYTWLHVRDRCAYPSLPGCEMGLRDDTGYGYDAWTSPDLRGHGLRRRAFLHELRVLRAAGKRFEGSFFVQHQLDGATRSLASAGIAVVPLWRIALRRDRTLAWERVGEAEGGGDAMWPLTTPS